MFGIKIMYLGTPMEAGDTASKSFVIERVNNIAKDYALDDNKRKLKDLKESWNNVEEKTKESWKTRR